jgi:hypothetical protein
MPILPVAEFAPDRPDLAEATSVLSNAVPITADAYGPVQSLQPYGSSALDGPCLGVTTVEDTSLAVHIFAGTADKLYAMTGAGPTWSDVSIVGGYTVASGENWRFALFNNTVIATDFDDPIQSYVMGSSTAFANLSASAPRARHICIAKSFCMVGNTFDAVGGSNPARLWWSAAGDPTSWPTPGSSAAQQVQSDFTDIPGNQGAITGLVANLGGCDVAIFFERAVWRGFYVGPPDVFDFYPAEAVRGCQCPNATVALGGIVYYPGNDGFYAYDGAQSVPIGTQKVDQWFWMNVNQAFLQNVIGTADVRNKLVLWAFPSIYAASGIPDTILMMRVDTGRWGIASMTLEWLSRFLSFGLTMDSMGAAGFTNVDTLPYTLDSPAWLGGALQIGAINTAHQLAFFSGSTLEAQIGTKVVQMTPERRTFVQSVRPLVDASGATIALSARVNYSDAEVFGTDVAVNAMGECPQRSDGRYHRARLTMPAGSSWTKFAGVDVTQAVPGGFR